MEELLYQVLEPILGFKCTRSILSFDLQDKICVKLLFSKIISAGIIAGSCIVKVPQILKIKSSKSTKGLSLLSYNLQNLAIIIALAYNYKSGNPFSTYGEGAALIIQNLIISVLIARDTKISNFVVALGFAALTIFSNFLLESSIQDLTRWQVISTVIGLGSKLPQIYTNFRLKSAGSLSVVTLFLEFAGTVARVFTTAAEVSDRLLLGSAVLAACLNGILLCQILFKKKKKE